MPVATLQKGYIYNRQVYGPGAAVDIPQGLYDLLDKKGKLGGGEPQPKVTPVGDKAQTSQALFGGLSEEQASNLKAAGFDNEEAIRQASVDDLKAVDGIGDATATKLKEKVDG